MSILILVYKPGVIRFGRIVYVSAARIVIDWIGLFEFALLELVIRNLSLDF